MLSIHELRNDLHSKVLAIRAIDRVVSTEDFAETYARANKDERIAVVNMIGNCNREGVEFWMRSQHNHEDGAKTIRELRLIGQQLGIRFYNRLPKALLLSEITKCRVVLMSSANCEKLVAS